MPLPGVGLAGYAAGAAAAAGLEFLLFLVLTLRHTGLRPPLFSWFLAPGLAALLSGLTGNLLLRALKERGVVSPAAMALTLVFSAVLYLAALHAQGVSLPRAAKKRPCGR